MLKWAVVGKGMMGNIVAPILRQAGGEVTAVIARNPDGIGKFVQDARLPRVDIRRGYDDIATAKLTLNHQGNRIPVELYLSQVEREVRPNYFQVEITFENGETVVWQQQEANRLEIYKNGEHQRIINRHSSPSISGRPGGHDNGYGDAILKEVIKFEDAIRKIDRGYTSRNLAMAVRATELCADWTRNPLQLYVPETWAHTELKPVAPTGRN